MRARGPLEVIERAQVAARKKFDRVWAQWRRAVARRRLFSAVLATMCCGSRFTFAADATPDAAAQGPDSATLEEIVVTSTKQTGNLQKAPVAITAISGQELIAEGISNLAGVQDLVPSARFQVQGASTEIYIRGVGSSLDFVFNEPPTSFNFNGIYIPREGTSVGLFDLDQIEVLPGPQGTLYGSGSLGGVVNVNFKHPTHELETSAILEAGNYSLAHATVVQNVPFNDALAVRAAINYTHHTGYETSGADSANDYDARLSALYTNEAVTGYFWYARAGLNGHPPNLVTKGTNPVSGALDPNAYTGGSNPWNDQFSGALLIQATTPPYGQPRAEQWFYSNNMFGGQIDLRLNDNMTLTYIPSWLNLHAQPNYWLGAISATNDADYLQTTHELRLAGASERINWLAGLYAYQRDAKQLIYLFAFDPSGYPETLVDGTTIKGVAAFGQGVVSITEPLRITLGGRYSADNRDGHGRFLAATGLAPFDYEGKFRHFDYKAGVDYDLTPKILTYAAIQTGYQPGTFNIFASTPTVSNAVGPAKLTAYTVGVKSRELNDTVQINNELFYYDYRGLTADAYNTLLNTIQIFNASKTEIYGDQLDIIYKPFSTDQFNLSVGWLHAHYKDFTLPDGTANYDGNQLQDSPNWTLSAGYFHDFPFTAGYIRAQVNTRYSDDFFSDFAHTPGARQAPYTKTDVAVTFFSADGKWSLGGWAKNLENAAVIAATGAGSTVPLNPQGGTPFLEPPRTYGVRATVNLR